MDYLKAIEYSSNQKDKISNIETVISALWENHNTVIRTGYGEEFDVRFSQRENYFDVVLSIKNNDIGFITLKQKNSGRYSIVNDSSINPHPAITQTAGHGLAVKAEHRKRGIGAALLSLGVGIAQKDYKARSTDEPFEVIATDVTGLGYGCYLHFGFKILPGMKETTAHYRDANRLPELKILRRKAGLLQRLKKRMHRD
ncbi:MAG: GNAT family N-acetyltransferase [Proteobacteria bacterium]|nr:GNAT family N-acetyltransferase [Pseudomonadota bacterium]MBU1710962.1 GNAT family N-acetyltransferase [Pseudomonadota bacterium]